MKAFHDADPLCVLVVVIHPDFTHKWGELCARFPDIPAHIWCTGGVTRSESVANGLKAALDAAHNLGVDTGLAAVAIHDGARPLIRPESICQGYESVSPGIGAVAACKAVNSLRKLNDSFATPRASEPIDRSLIAEVHTPQIFVLSEISELYNQHSEEAASGIYTDDASFAQAYGTEIILWDDNASNIKVTYKDDFIIAGALLEAWKKE